MPDNDVLDFSAESDLKENLWNKVEQKLTAAPKREAVSLDSLTARPKVFDKPEEEKTAPSAERGMKR